MNKKISEKSKTIIRRYISGIKIIPFLRKILPYGVVYAQNCNQIRREVSREKLPDLFNANGEKVCMLYMAGNAVKDCLTAGRTPHNILWNHWDITLPVHFYGYLEIEEAKRVKNEAIKCLYIQESRAIIPLVYKYLLNHPEIADLFQFIFTSDYDILNKYQNARFLPAGGVWYGTERWGGKPSVNLYKSKCKNISILSSYKARCELHRFRKDIALYYTNSGIVDTFGSYNGGREVKPWETLNQYRYSIVIENQQSPYYFTEKIMNCFASFTVPIYVGASKIGEFFNEDGIIQLAEPTIAALEEAIQLCGQEDYCSRRRALFDNFERVKAFLTPEDYLYTHYQKELFNDWYNLDTSV